MNEYESHLSSYDHAHKQRLKDMKAMQRDPAVAERARRLEAKGANAVISIKLGGNNDSSQDGASPSGGIKKGGFRKGGFKSAFSAVTDESQDGQKVATPAEATADGASQPLSAPIISMPAVSLAPSSAASVSTASTSQLQPPKPLPVAGADQTDTSIDESDTDDEYELYDPRKPTD